MRSNTGAPNNSPPLPFLIIGVGLIKILLQYIIDFSENGREEGLLLDYFLVIKSGIFDPNWV